MIQLIDPIYIALLLQNLDDTRFVEFGNALLSEVIARHGIDRSCLATNLNVKEPDGGIDAHCVDAPKKVGRVIPRSNTDYQFKSGMRRKSVAEIAEDDIIKKPRVMQGLQDGHAFVFIAAWDRGDEIESDIIKALVARGVTVDADQVIFFGVDSMARLLLSFPALTARFLKFDLPIIDFEEWATRPPFRNQYVTDQALEDELSALRSQMLPSGARVRLVGAAGNGKTRMALEALRHPGLTDSVLYVDQVSSLEANFVAHLKRTPDIVCTLVVDEVDDEEAERLINRFSSMPSGIRLVMIGLDASGRAQPGTLQVEGLSEELLARAVLTIIPGLAADVAGAIARDCKSSPKLAVLIARRISENPELVVPTRRLTDGVVWSALDRYLRIDRNSSAWEALSASALLMRLGWADNMEAESETLFRTLGLDPTRARREVQELHERYGVAPVAGRYRYISPAILADYLAARQLSAWTRERLMSVWDAFTPAMADSFVRRIRRLGGALENKQVVEEVILGSQGPFRSLDDLETSRNTALFRHLAGPFRHATLAALRRLIGEASLDALRAAKNSRRDLVWALEMLLWPEDTFAEAAILLLRLALAENETWGNNATNTWVETFQTIRGRTAAGWAARCRVLRQAASQPDPSTRRLVARAIGAALQIGEIRRSGSPPSDVDGRPIEEWRPGTYAEWEDAILAYLDLLERPLLDTEAIVRHAAAEALAAGVSTTVVLPSLNVMLSSRVMDRWVSLAYCLAGETYALRNAINEAVRWEQERWHDLAEQDDLADAKTRAELQRRINVLAQVGNALRGEDFSSRLRSTLTQARHPVVAGEENERAELLLKARLEALATEAIDNPRLLDTEWDWLREDDNWDTPSWVEVLGRMDRQRVFEPSLRQYAEQHAKAVMWLSLYDMAYANAIEDPNFVDSRLTQLLSIGASGTQILDLAYRSGYTPSRFVLLLGLFKTGAVRASAIDAFAYSPWGTAMPAADALQLAEAAAQKADVLEEVLRFVSGYLDQVKTATDEFRELALGLLARHGRASEVSNARFVWAFSRIARTYIDIEPVRVALATIEQLAIYKYQMKAEAISLLRRAWEIGDKVVLFNEVFAPAITDQTSSGWHVREYLRGFLPLEQVGVAFLTDWIDVAPETRAYCVADILGPPGKQVSELHALLLERYGQYGIGDTFSARFRSGGYTGTASGWMQSKIDYAKQWTADKRPAVKDWANDLIRSLHRSLRAYEEMEAEASLVS